MPKLIKRYRYAKLKTVTKISDINYMYWKWRRKYIGFIGELSILQSEEKFPGQYYLYFTNHRLNWITSGYGEYTTNKNKLIMTTKNSIYEFEIIEE